MRGRLPSSWPSTANEQLTLVIHGLQRHRKTIAYHCDSLDCTVTWEEDPTTTVERLEIEIIKGRLLFNITLWSTRDIFVYLGNPRDRSTALSFYGLCANATHIAPAIKDTLSTFVSDMNDLRTLWSKAATFASIS